MADDPRDKLLQEISKTTIYASMDWPSDVQFLQFYECAAAPFGGPLALVPKHPRPSSIEPFLRVFNASGSEITRFNWYDDHVKALGWSSGEELFCVQRDGRIMRYDTTGQCQLFYSIFDEDEQEDAVDVAKVWPRGIAVITCLFQIYLFPDLSEGALDRPNVLSFQPHANPTGNQYASAVGLVEGHCNQSGQSEILYALWDTRAHVATIVVSTPSKSLEVPLQKLYPPCPGDVNCVVDMTVHDDGKYVAIITVSGSVTIFSADFAQTFVHIELRSVTPPTSALWFGRQFQSHATLAVAWTKPPVLMLCDLASGVRWIPIDSNFIIVSEIDGLRLVSKQESAFFQRIFLNDSGKYLMQIYESSKKNKFASVDQRSRVLSIMLDTGKLQEGITQALQAAEAQFTSEDQKTYIEAALMGKKFVNRWRSFDAFNFKMIAGEVKKAQQQSNTYSTENGLNEAFLEAMRQRAFAINRIFSEFAKRMRLRNSLLMKASHNGRHSDSKNGGQQAASRHNGRFLRYGQELHSKNTSRGSNDNGHGNARTLPCIPLTGKQHKALGEAAIIRRLVQRQSFEFAAQVCNFLSWSKESVLLHWSRAKIRSLPADPDQYEGTTAKTDRDKLIDSMVQHLDNQKFRCFAHLALAAHQCQDDHLASRMLLKEDSLNQKIGASLLMNKYEDALRMAVASRDEQLCLALLVHLKRHKYLHDEMGYMRLLDRVPYAHTFLLSLRRQQSGDGSKLYDLLLRDSPSVDETSGDGSSWKREDSPTVTAANRAQLENEGVQVAKFRDAGNLMLGLAASCQDPKEKLKYLEKALEAFSDKQAPPDLAPSAQLVRESIGLLNIQLTKLPPNMRNLSLYDTIRECSARSDGGGELADSMKDLFRIDNSNYYRLKIAGLAQDNRWHDLQVFSRKGGVVKALGSDGLRIFVKEAVAANAPFELAASFFDRIRDRKQRMMACIDLQDYELAAAIAMDLGDSAMVNVIISKTGIRSNYQKQEFVNAAQQRDPRGKIQRR